MLGVKLLPAVSSKIYTFRCLHTHSDFLKEFTPIYQFPFIRAMSIVNRLKVYQTLFATASTSTCFLLSELKVVPPEAVLYTAGIGLTITIAFNLAGLLADNFVGYIYLKEDHKCIKVAYVDNWGLRKEVDIHLDDLVPQSEVPVSLSDKFYSKLKRFSSKETFKVNFKYGIILDNDFNKVFPLVGKT